MLQRQEQKLKPAKGDWFLTSTLSTHDKIAKNSPKDPPLRRIDLHLLQKLLSKSYAV